MNQDPDDGRLVLWVALCLNLALSAGIIGYQYDRIKNLEADLTALEELHATHALEAADMLSEIYEALDHHEWSTK